MTKMVGNYELAPLGIRFVALLIDGIILGVIAGLLFGAARGAGGGIAFVVGLVYYWYFLTRQEGQTLGKRWMGIRVVKTDGAPLSDSDAILRFIGYYINSAVILIAVGSGRFLTAINRAGTTKSPIPMWCVPVRFYRLRVRRASRCWNRSRLACVAIHIV
jgi:uncharacterized RDD family membrane protein YckC